MILFPFSYACAYAYAYVTLVHTYFSYFSYAYVYACAYAYVLLCQSVNQPLRLCLKERLTEDNRNNLIQSVTEEKYLLQTLAGLLFHGSRIESVNSKLLFSEKAAFGITASSSSKPP